MQKQVCEAFPQKRCKISCPLHTSSNQQMHASMLPDLSHDTPCENSFQHMQQQRQTAHRPAAVQQPQLAAGALATAATLPAWLKPLHDCAPDQLRSPQPGGLPAPEHMHRALSCSRQAMHWEYWPLECVTSVHCKPSASNLT